MSLKETVVKLTCVLAIFGCFMQTASANWYDDLKPNTSWVEIEGNNFVAGTFYGVPSYYNEGNSNYQCGELVIRFYKEAYGLDIRPYSEPVPTSYTEGYKFVKTSSPKPGDIIYVSKEMRGSSTDHWAIVKSYSDGYITMFEQNARYSGKAAVDRQIKYPSDSYYIFTPVSTGNAPAPTLKNAVTGESDKQPETTKETTTESTTATATTAPTTTKAATTVPVTETTKAATTKAQTTKPTTTKPVTTTQEVTTTEITTEAETTTAPITEAVTEVYSADIETESVTAQAQTQSVGDLLNKKTTLIAACAGTAAVVALAAFVIRKKRNG